MPRISTEIRSRVIDMIKGGNSQRDVAKQLSISRRAVQNTWKKYLQNGTTDDLPKSGRPPKNDERSERRLVRLSKASPKLTAAELRHEWHGCKAVSIWTVRGILRKYGLHGRIAARQPYLSKKNISIRKYWCRQYMPLPASFWNSVIFTDECSVSLHCNKRQYVRRPAKTKFVHRYTSKVVKYGGKSLLIWGAIKYDGTRLLVKCPDRLNSEGYQDILRCHFLPFYDAEEILQQDNAPCHRSKSTMTFIENSNICLISDWPAQSPDINIIENLWSILKRNITRCRMNTIDDLWEECQRQWMAIPTESIQHLYHSIPSRLLSVVRNKGMNIPY